MRRMTAFAALWAALPAGGLVAAIPFCVLTASPRVSAWLRARSMAATPEELEGSRAGGTQEPRAAAEA